MIKSEQLFLKKLTHTPELKHTFKKTQNRYEYYDFFNENRTIYIELKERNYKSHVFDTIYINRSKLALTELELIPDTTVKAVIFIFIFTDKIIFYPYRQNDLMKLESSYIYNQRVAHIPRELCITGYKKLIEYINFIE